MNLAPCPNCGGKTAADQDRFYGGVSRWVVACDEPNDTRSLPSCGYRGPFALTLDEAVRKHNKISQNCGACIPDPVDIVGHVKGKCGQ